MTRRSALRRVASVVLALPFLLALLAVPASAEEVIVEMRRFAFIPEGEVLQADVTVQVGDTVTWVYAEDPTDPTGCGPFNGPAVTCPGHSTTSVDGIWDSQIFGKDVPPSQTTYEGNRFSVRFDQPGTYQYICTAHEGLPTAFNNLEGMTAAVVVEGEASGGGGGGEGGSSASPVTRPTAATGAAEGLFAVAGLTLLALGLMLRRSLRSP